LVNKKEIIKPLIVAITAALIDFYVHQTSANVEVASYYIFKVVLYYVVAYYVLEPNKIRSFLNIFKLKDKTIPFYLYFSFLAAFYHGFYYRILDWYSGLGFFSFARVGDVTLFHFSDNVFIEGILDWALVHGFSFFIGLILVEQLDKRRLI